VPILRNGRKWMNQTRPKCAHNFLNEHGDAHTVAFVWDAAAKMPALKVIADTVRRLKRESGRVADVRQRVQAGAAPATVGE